MSVFDYTIDRSGCPSQYIFNDITCCNAHRPEYGHVRCVNVKDMKCYWALNGRIERLEQVVAELIGGEE